MLSSGGAAGAVAGLAGHVVTGEIVDGGRDGDAVGGHLPARRAAAAANVQRVTLLPGQRVPGTRTDRSGRHDHDGRRGGPAIWDMARSSSTRGSGCGGQGTAGRACLSARPVIWPPGCAPAELACAGGHVGKQTRMTGRIIPDTREQHTAWPTAFLPRIGQGGHPPPARSAPGTP